jgi:glycosyltransferase involved in cell wall biosynthesis
MNSPSISILIPTFNRAKDLDLNLGMLYTQLQAAQLLADYRIIVSDNCSTDDTAEVLARYAAAWPAGLLLAHHNSQNIGLEANAVQVLSLAQTPYVLFLGDDDFLDEGYLAYALRQIQAQPQMGCLITGIYSIDNDMKIMDNPRPTDFEEKILPAGYASLYEASHLGNQLSGLVLRREGLLDAYLAQPSYRNPYLFIFFVAHSLYHHGGLYAPKFKTRVKVLNAKAWDYNGVGLLDEVYKSYYYFLALLPAEQVAQLLLRFTRLHAHRFAISPWHPWRLWGQYRLLLSKMPTLPGFAKALRSLLLKEYLLSWRKR